MTEEDHICDWTKQVALLQSQLLEAKDQLRNCERQKVAGDHRRNRMAANCPYREGLDCAVDNMGPCRMDCGLNRVVTNHKTKQMERHQR